MNYINDIIAGLTEEELRREFGITDEDGIVTNDDLEGEDLNEHDELRHSDGKS